MTCCPVCKCELLPSSPIISQRTFTFNCPRCGAYTITDEALTTIAQEIGAEPLRWAITSYAIRRMRSTSNAPYKVMQAWLRSVWANEKLPRPQEQADNLIRYLGTAELAPSSFTERKRQYFIGLLGTADCPVKNETAGFSYILDRLVQKGLLEQRAQAAAGSVAYRLSFEGWERYDDLYKGSVEGRTAFMAMGYRDSNVDQAFQEFNRAVAQTGFDLRRLDAKPKAGLIDLRMRVEIRSASFLVADLTTENRGAYWEAGFAEGLGKKVYYTCEESKFDKAKTHFDTEHLLTIKWNLVNMPSALDELRSVIRNDFPLSALQSDSF